MACLPVGQLGRVNGEWTLGDVGGGGVGDSIASILFSVYLAAQDAEACSSKQHGASAQQAGPLHTCSINRERRPVPFLLPTIFSGPAASAVAHSSSVFGGAGGRGVRPRRPCRFPSPH